MEALAVVWLKASSLLFGKYEQPQRTETRQGRPPRQEPMDITGDWEELLQAARQRFMTERETLHPLVLKTEMEAAIETLGPGDKVAEKIEERVVPYINRFFAVLVQSHKPQFIFKYNVHENKSQYTIVDTSMVANILEPGTITHKTLGESKSKSYSSFKIWLKSDHRLFFTQMGIQDPERAPPDFFNLWTGARIEPEMCFPHSGAHIIGPKLN
jgi:hypothetical protein